MPDSRQAVNDPELPTFDPKKSYLVKGNTLNRFKSIMKRNRVRAVSGGGIKIVQETAEGIFTAIDADELVLSVCINGVATSKTFYVKRTAGS